MDRSEKIMMLEQLVAALESERDGNNPFSRHRAHELSAQLNLRWHPTLNRARALLDEARERRPLEYAVMDLNLENGRIRRVAVVQIDPETLPGGRSVPRGMTTSYRGFIRTVKLWDNVVKPRRNTPDSPYSRALREAEELAKKLNSDR